MTSEITRRINLDTSVSIQRIEATIRLIQDGATIPFIARYRKEATGNLDEARLRQVAERYLAYGQLVEKRTEVLSAIEGQGHLNDRLRERIENCESEYQLEDLYLSYRPKRQSKANLARRRGLEPLADYIHQQSGPTEVEEVATRFVSAEKNVENVEAALEGALHIVAERIAGDVGCRRWLRDLMVTEGKVLSKVVKAKEGQKTKYSTYYDFSEPVTRIPSHRILAIRRGTREKILSYSIEIDDDKARAELRSRARMHPRLPSAELIDRAINDSYDRLLKPVIQNEVRTILRKRAEGEAIRVFEENLSALLLAPPAGAITVLGIDPNLKGSSKLAVVGGDGSPIEHQALRLVEKKRNIQPSRPETDSRKQTEATPSPEPSQAQPAAEKVETAAEAASKTVKTEAAESGPEPIVQPASETDGTPVPETEAQPEATGPEASATGQTEATATETVETAAQTNLAAQDLPPAEAPDVAAAHTQETPPPDTAGPAAAEAREAPPAEPPDMVLENAEQALVDILKRTKTRGIVIGHGAGSREVETLVRSTLQKHEMDVFVVVAKEAGAGVYATSPRAREELPELDVATRRAVSIARRLQDPLAELAKIDPKSIGVGQYQHDVDQDKLEVNLEAVVGSAVNHVGVDVNRASPDLLRYAAGFSGEIAKNVVDYRNANGPFSTLEDLRKIDNIDDRVFSQAAGFLKIKDGTQPLDRTFIHPESYPIAEKMAESVGSSPAALLGKTDKVRSIKFESFEKDIGRYTLGDIRNELFKPGRDPRKAFAVPRFRNDVRAIGDLKEGMALEGTVTNVTNFGAFVDIGVRQDGLVHISELSHSYVSDARQAAQIGDVVKVKVVGVDSALKRISLSVKAATPKPQPRPRPRKRTEDGRADGPEARGGRPRRPRTKEAAVSTWKQPRRVGSRQPEPPRTPTRQLSMEEKIRMLQEKFKGPDR